MGTDVLRFLAYHHDLWRRFADYYVDECTWQELSENHESSHNTIANATMHAVNMEDWWLHYVVPGKEWDGPKWDGFRDADSMRRRIHDVQTKTEKLLAGITPEELRRKRTFDMGGEKHEATLEEVLHEIITETFHHRGEVLAMLWRNNKEPPYVGYLEWLNEQKR